MPRFFPQLQNHHLNSATFSYQLWHTDARTIPGTRVEVNKIKAYSLKKNFSMYKCRRISFEIRTHRDSLSFPISRNILSHKTNLHTFSLCRNTQSQEYEYECEVSAKNFIVVYHLNQRCQTLYTFILIFPPPTLFSNIILLLRIN